MTKDNIKSIGKKNWIQRWSGSYTFISCDYWGPQYFKSIKNYLGVGFKHSLFIHKKGTASFYLIKEEFDSFGKNMAGKASLDLSFVKNNLKALEENSDKINSLMKKLHNSIPTFKQYKEFLVLYEKHLPLHNFMKKTVDFLDGKSLKRLLPLFRKSRLYSEDI